MRTALVVALLEAGRVQAAAPVGDVLDASSGEVTCYNLKAPAEDAALTTAIKPRLFDWSTWYVRVELDGMVFSPTPQLGTSGPGSGIGFASMDENVLAGGAAQARSAVEPEHER